MLIDATMKRMPPLALPKREYMENAKALWERLGLPPLSPQIPWFGYSLGDWNETWDGNGRARPSRLGLSRRKHRQRRRRGVAPNTSTRVIEGMKDDD